MKMGKIELKQHTKELYESVLDLLKDEENIQLALYEHIFDDPYIQAQILLMEYFKIIEVPKEVLEISLNCEIEERIYKAFYKHIQNEWLKKAYKEIGVVITEMEKN